MTAPYPATSEIIRAWTDACRMEGAAPFWLESRRSGWGRMQFGRSMSGGPLMLGTGQHASGLGCHADSEIRLSTVQGIRRFRALAGIDRGPLPRSRSDVQLRFSLEAPGTVLWQRDLHGDGVETIDLPVPAGVRDLTMRVHSLDGNLTYAHADWAGVEIDLEDGTTCHVDRDPGEGLLRLELPPVSFRCDGRPSRELLPTWTRSCDELPAETGRRKHRITWRDPASGLACLLDLTVFADEAAVEWLLRFRHDGAGRAPLLEDLQAIEQTWMPPNDRIRTDLAAPVRMHRALGSECTISDFMPTTDDLPEGGRVAMASTGGRSSHGWMPFFDLCLGETGVTTAIGWSGQWACSCAHDAGGVHLRAGLERTCIRLEPGEEIRQPRILQLLWHGDRVEAHNRWRQLLLRHYVPRGADGGPISAPASCMHWGGMPTAMHQQRIDRMRSEGLAYDLHWVDAGWYGPPGDYSLSDLDGEWAKYVGDWRPNTTAHPQSMRVLGASARDAGMGLLLWVEPERAVVGTPWAEQHPDWFLGQRRPLGNLLLDLGNAEARAHVTGHLSSLISEAQIAGYRQDFNMEPLPYWRANDAPERIGMTEIRHIEGLYAMWDDLLRRHPGLLIDNCASGGRRIDLETISRSIPLWRSDWQCWPGNDPDGGQVHSMALSPWVPLHGTGIWTAMPAAAGDTYRMRCAFGPATAFAAFPLVGQADDGGFPWDWQRRMLADWRRLQPSFTGDYYPLTPVDTGDDVWLAYQMHRPGPGAGFVIAFRHRASPWLAAQFRLRGLDPGATYEIEDLDDGRVWRMDGTAMAEGIELTLPKPRSSRILVYRRI